MGILDWFKNRPGQYDPDRVSDELVQWGGRESDHADQPPTQAAANLPKTPDTRCRDHDRILA